MDKEVLNDRYEVLCSIGRGGMGEVLLVADRQQGGRVIALKRLSLAGTGPEAIEQFQAEFVTLSKLRHPNLAEVYDFGVDHATDEPFFTSEFVDGLDLFVATASAPLADLYEIVVHIGRGLEYIHSRGVIHRDIKPSNIMVRERPDARAGLRYLTKLIDFGLAHERSLAASAVKGTVSYLPPEVIRMQAADRRSDLYSLGVTLYYVATRRLPFEGESNADILNQHLSRAPRDPREVRADVPDPLAELVLRLLEKDPARRFPSALDLCRFVNERTGSRFAIDTKETRESYVRSGRFVGREREQETLRQAFARAVARAGPDVPALVVVQGERGAGKSRLIRELKQHVQLSRASFVEGACVEAGARAYGPFVEVARQLLPEAEAAAARGAGPLSSPRAAEARRHLQAIGAAAGLAPSPEATPAPVDPEREKLRRIDALTEFVLGCARERPLVVHLRDLQWADPESVELLRYLAHNLRLQAVALGSRMLDEALSAADAANAERGRLPLLLLGTVRAGEVEGPTAAALEAMRAEGLAEEVSLDPLGEEAVRALVASMLGLGDEGEEVAPWLPALAARLFHEARGNPFFVEELMKALLEASILRAEGGRWLLDEEGLARFKAPAGVEEAFRERFARLRAEEAQLLRTLSVSRRPVGAPLVEGVAGLKLRDVFSTLEPLVRKSILYCPRPGAYAFVHEIMREAIYEDLAPQARKDLHARMGAALEALVAAREEEPNPAELLHHFERAGDRAKALDCALAAGEEAARIYANRRAIEHYEKALELIPAEDATRRAAVDERVGRILDLVGDFARATSHYEAILASGAGAEGAALGPVESARVRRRIGEILEKQGSYDRALDSYSLGMAALGARLKGDEGARLLNATGSVYVKKGLYDMATAFCRSGLEMLEGMPESPERAAILNTIGVALSCKGDYLEAEARFLASLEARRALGDLDGIAQSLNNLGTVLVERGRVAEAIASFEESLALKERIGHTQGIAEAASNLGNAHHQAGDAERAIRCHLRSLEIRERLGDTEGLVVTLNSLGALYDDRAEYGLAIQKLEQAVRLNLRVGETREVVISYNGLARVMLNLYVLDRAEALAEEALRLASLYEIKREQAHAFFILGRIDDRRNRLEEAERFYNRALTLFNKMDLKQDATKVMLAVVLLCLERGDRQIASLAYEKAEAVLREWKLEKLLGRALLLKAEIVRDDPALVHKTLEEALDWARRLRRPELEWQAFHAHGRFHDARGDFEKAARHYVQAMEGLKAIWARAPEQYRAAFLADPRRQAVARDFKALRARLLARGA